MNIDQINAELQTIVQEELEMEHEEAYNDMMNEMYAYHEMMMYMSYSYEQDAIAYSH